MNKQQVIEAAIKTADYNGFKGKMLSTADGNTFLWRDQGSLNAAINHVRSTKKNNEEQLIYVVDNRSAKPTCEIFSSEELLKEKPTPVDEQRDQLRPKDDAKAKAKADADAKAKADEDAAAKAKAEEEEAEKTKVTDYSEFTKVELKALCEERGIPLGKATKNDDIIALIVADDIAKASK